MEMVELPMARLFRAKVNDPGFKANMIRWFIQYFDEPVARLVLSGCGVWIDMANLEPTGEEMEANSSNIRKAENQNLSERS